MKINFAQVKASILDVKEDKRNECFNFGKDNAYPSLISFLVANSVTAKNCVDRVAKAIYGGSFGEAGLVIVNSRGQSLNEVLRVAGRQYGEQNNVFLQVGYDFDLNFKSIVVIPVNHARVGKADDKGYSGKIIVYNNWDKTEGGKIMKSKFRHVDVFNPSKEVVQRQVDLAGGFSEYYGQIIHIKKDDSAVYSLSDLHPVLGEAVVEINSQKFRVGGSEKGFLNTKIMAVQPFTDDNERRQFRKELNDVRGAENSSEVLVLEASQKTDDLKKQFVMEDLSSPYDDKLFEYSEDRAERNIVKAWSVPYILINPTHTGLGNSGEMVKEAKKELYESREEDRDQLEEVFVNIMSNFQTPLTGLKILNPFEELDKEIEEEEENK